jgi:prefoldin subunit 5
MKIMKFKQYIEEKITKKEFDEALTNRNIKAGCEFEFYLNDGGFSSIDINRTARLERESDREIDKINRNIREYNTAIEQMERTREELERENERFDDKVTDAEAEIERIEAEIEEFELEADEIVGEDARIVKNLKSIKSLQGMIDDNNRRMDDNERTIKEIDNGEYGDDLQSEYEPVPSRHSIPTFFELLEYLTDQGYYIESLSDSEYNEKLFEEYEDGVIGDTNYLFNVFFGFYLNDLLNEPAMVGIPDESSLMDMDFPYDLNKPGWEAKEDGSLNSDENGIEIVTGIEALPDLIDIIENVFD